MMGGRMKRPGAAGINTVATKKRRVEEDGHETAGEADSTTPTTAPSSTSNTHSLAPTSLTSSRSQKQRPKKYICPFGGCEKAFDRPVRLQAHERTHTNDRPFACQEPDCGKAFFKSEHLKAHAQNKHVAVLAHICDYVVRRETTADGRETKVPCGKAFTTATRLRRHVAAHRDKEDRRCAEPGCGRVFRRLETLQRHVRADHWGEKAFECTHVDDEEGQECGERFEAAGQLRTHVASQHAGRRYACEVCRPGDDETGAMTSVGGETTSGIFASYAALQAHRREAHPPVCPEPGCGQVCVSARALTAHREIAHSTLSARRARFPCPEPGCGRGFTRRGNLHVHHQTVHVRYRPFVCGEYDLLDPQAPSASQVAGWDGKGCGVGFGMKSTLIGHVRSHHLGLPASTTEKKNKRKSHKRATMGDDDAMAEGVRTLALLTGCGYEKSRPLACWTVGCQARFVRQYDLGQHMECGHGWGVDRINERFAAEAMEEEDEFWVGGVDEGEESGDEERGEMNEGFFAEGMALDPVLGTW